MKTSNTDLTLTLLFQNTILRLKTLRLTVSHAYMNRKLDEFGHQHDQHIKDCISQQSRRLEQMHFTCEEVEETSLKDTKIDTTSEGSQETENRKISSCITKQSFNACKNQIEDFEAEPVSISNHPILFKKAACTENTADVQVHLSTKMQFEKDVDIILPEMSTSNAANNHKASEATVPSIPPDTGRKIGFDNIDWHMDVHHMTEEVLGQNPPRTKSPRTKSPPDKIPPNCSIAQYFLLYRDVIFEGQFSSTFVRCDIFHGHEVEKRS